MKNRRAGVRAGERQGAAARRLLTCTDVVVRAGCALLLLAAPSCQQPFRSPEPPPTKHPLLGSPAPHFEVAAQNASGSLSLERYAGKVVMVDFWATWCLPCKESLPFYQSLVEKYAGELVVLALSVDEDPSKIAEFVADAKVSFPVGWDEGQVVSGMYDPPTMPTSYLIDENGVIVSVHAGFESGDEQAIRQELDGLLKE